jgi:hypothetical protein
VTYATHKRYIPNYFYDISKYIILILSIFISGFRAIGYSKDYYTYYSMYYSDSILNWKEVLFTPDPSYHVLSKISFIIGFPFYKFSFLISTITCIILFSVFSKIECNRKILLLIYGSNLFWIHEYTQIRISIAVSIFLYSIYVAKYKFKFILFVLSFLFHSSILLLILIYILCSIKNINYIKHLIFISSLILFYMYFKDTIFSHIDKLNVYNDLNNKNILNKTNIFSLSILFQIISVSIITLTIYYKYNFNDVVSNIELVISFYGIILFYLFSDMFVLALRFNELFLVIFVILLAKFYNESIVIKFISYFYMLYGIYNVFFSVDPIINFQFGITNLII